MWFGAGRGADNAVIALIGSGVGAAIVTAGAPYRGATSSAGEWGHTVVQVGGRACRCGAVGCLEAYVGAQAVLDRYGRAAPGDRAGQSGADGVEEGGAEGAGEDQQTAFAAIVANAGTETRAREVLEETAAYLGAGIADLINLFNPERIILGGWAGLLLGGRVLPRIRAATASYALHRPYAQTEIGMAELGPTPWHWARPPFRWPTSSPPAERAEGSTSVGSGGVGSGPVSNSLRQEGPDLLT
ncbi:hypothetical protein GCM10017744_022210 [Streptomyces antimycoticus]